MPRINKERLIDEKTEYINRDGVLLKKVTSYSVVSGATFRDANITDEPTISEFRNVLGLDNKDKPSGEVVGEKRDTVYSSK